MRLGFQIVHGNEQFQYKSPKIGALYDKLNDLAVLTGLLFKLLVIKENTNNNQDNNKKHKALTYRCKRRKAK
jgi:hypothetical protein